MNKRPTSITVICWILIVVSLISVVVVSILMKSPLFEESLRESPVPVNVQYAVMYAGMLITLVSGIAMLKGRNWARYLYIVYSAVSFIYSMVTTPVTTSMIPAFVIFLIIAFFLLRAKADAYFTGGGAQVDTEST